MGRSSSAGPDKVVAVEHIDLHLTPDIEAETLEGVCTTTVRALDEEVRRLSLDAVDLEVRSVRRDGKGQRFARRNGKLDVEFEPPIAAGERATFAVEYRAVKPRHGLFFVKPTADQPRSTAG